MIKKKCIVMLFITMGLVFITANYYTLQAKDKEPIKERTFDRPDLGFKIVKPVGKEWVITDTAKLSAQSVCALLRWKSDKPEERKGRPLLTISIKAYKIKTTLDIDGKKVESGDIKEYSRVSFKKVIKQYKDTKEVKKPHQTRFSFVNKAWDWSFYGRHKEKRYTICLRCIVFNANKQMFVMILTSQPGDEKKLTKEIKYILKHIKIYKPKKE